MKDFPTSKNTRGKARTHTNTHRLTFPNVIYRGSVRQLFSFHFPGKSYYPRWWLGGNLCIVSIHFRLKYDTSIVPCVHTLYVGRNKKPSVAPHSKFVYSGRTTRKSRTRNIVDVTYCCSESNERFRTVLDPNIQCETNGTLLYMCFLGVNS